MKLLLIFSLLSLLPTFSFARFSSQNEGGGPVRNEEQLKQVKKCQDRACVFRTMGLTETSWTDKGGREVLRIDGPNLETMVFHDLLGQINEVLFIRTNGTTHSKIEFFPDGRKTTYFKLDGRIERQIIEGNGFRKTVTYRFGKKQETFEKINRFAYERGRIHQCVAQEYGAVINNQALVGRLGQELGSVLRQNNGSNDWNIAFHGCPQNRQEQIKNMFKEAMSEGIQCLLDADRGGSERGTRDAVLLGLMTMNPDRPFNFSCPQNIIVDGQQFEGMAEPIGGPMSPGLMIDVDLLAPTPGNSAQDLSEGQINDNKLLIFHEAIHNIGHEHEHNQIPDITRACEACCFAGIIGADSRDDAELDIEGVCRLCRMGDDAIRTSAQKVEYAVEFMRNEHLLHFNIDPNRNWAETLGGSLQAVLSARNEESYPNALVDFSSRILENFGTGELTEQATAAAEIGVELPAMRSALIALYIHKEFSSDSDEQVDGAIGQLERIVSRHNRNQLKVLARAVALKKQGADRSRVIDGMNTVIRARTSSAQGRSRLSNSVTTGAFSALLQPFGISFETN